MKKIAKHGKKSSSLLGFYKKVIYLSVKFYYDLARINLLKTVGDKMKNKIILILSLVCYANQSMAMENNDQNNSVQLNKIIQKITPFLQMLKENKIDSLSIGILGTSFAYILAKYILPMHMKDTLINHHPYSSDDGIGGAVLIITSMISGFAGLYGLYDFAATNTKAAATLYTLLTLLIIKHLKNKPVGVVPNMTQNLPLD